MAIDRLEFGAPNFQKAGEKKTLDSNITSHFYRIAGFKKV